MKSTRDPEAHQHLDVAIADQQHLRGLLRALRDRGYINSDGDDVRGPRPAPAPRLAPVRESIATVGRARSVRVPL